jgi:hypothetical protein
LTVLGCDRPMSAVHGWFEDLPIVTTNKIIGWLAEVGRVQVVHSHWVTYLAYVCENTK